MDADKPIQPPKEITTQEIAETKKMFQDPSIKEEWWTPNIAGQLCFGSNTGYIKSLLISLRFHTNITLTQKAFNAICANPLFAKDLQDKTTSKIIRTQEEFDAYVTLNQKQKHAPIGKNTATVNSTIEIYTSPLEALEAFIEATPSQGLTNVIFLNIVEKFKHLTPKEKEYFIDSYFQEKGLFKIESHNNRQLLEAANRFCIDPQNKISFNNKFVKDFTYAFAQGKQRKTFYDIGVAKGETQIRKLREGLIKDIRNIVPVEDATFAKEVIFRVPGMSFKEVQEINRELKSNRIFNIKFGQTVADQTKITCDSSEKTDDLFANPFTKKLMETMEKENLLANAKTAVLTKENLAPHKCITYQEKYHTVMSSIKNYQRTIKNEDGSTQIKTGDKILDEERNPFWQYMKRVGVFFKTHVGTLFTVKSRSTEVLETYGEINKYTCSPAA